MSSSFFGRPGDPWILPEALRALGKSAESALQRWWLWLPGMFYPSLLISVEAVQGVLGVVEESTDIHIPGASSMGQLLNVYGQVPLGDWDLRRSAAVLLLALPLFVLIYRFVVGLAKVSDVNADAEHAGLGAAWRAGRGLGLPACGMWWVLTSLLMVTLLFLIGPLVVLVELFGIRSLNAMLVGLLIPLLALVLAYAIVLQVVFQLALHSMAHNRRGVASALHHGWRLIRMAPWSALRATVVDFLLFLAFVAIKSVLTRTFDEALGTVLLFVALGWVGVTRATYWSRAYRALGGLSAADKVPGLQLETS